MTASWLVPTLLVGVLAGALPAAVLAQNCGCGAYQCCSQFGYCGVGDPYCGAGCQAGPCESSPPSSSPGGGVSVSDVVTTDFFNGILDQARDSCVGKTFYTRRAFLDAVGSYPEFGQGDSAADSKREIAAFFAHVTYETGNLCYVEEPDGSLRTTYCFNSTKYPCASGKAYYGRGPLQIAWNYNYGEAGDSIGFDGLNHPETVSYDSVVSFKTALWFWMNNVHPVISKGFGATIRAINMMECDGGNNEAAKARIGYYKDYCTQLGVSTGYYSNQVHIF